MNRNKLILIFTILLFMILIVFIYFNLNSKKITDFASCSKAGNPILETYPRSCSYNNVRYVEPLSEEDKKKLQPPQ